MIEASSKSSEFIQLQNARLKDQIQDLKDMIRVNKESINILSQGKDRGHRHNNTASLDDHDAVPPKTQESSQLKDIIKILNSKNSEILDELFKLQRENEDLRSKLLLLEQITEGYEDQEKRNIQMIESQLKSLSRNLVSANEKLSESEKHKFQVDNISGLAIKLKEIYSPTQQAMKFEAQEFRLRQELAIRKLQCIKKKEQNRNLEKLNMTLQNELVKMKTALLMPNKPLDKIGEASIKKLALYFLEAQRKVLEDEDSDEEFEDIEIMAPELVALFPERVEKYKMRKEEKHVSLPKLDLAKVRELMNYNKKFVEAELRRRNNMSPTQRIKMLEEELEFTRRQLTRALLLLKDEEFQKNNLERQFIELQARHKLVQKSHESIAKKMASLSRNQLKKPDLNQTINAIMFQKNSPSLLANFKPAMQTKETYKSLGEDMTVEDYRAEIYAMQEEIASLPYFSTKKIRKPSLKNQTHGMVRSSSNPNLALRQKPEPDQRAMFQQKPEINRHQENLDEIQI